MQYKSPKKFYETNEGRILSHNENMGIVDRICSGEVSTIYLRAKRSNEGILVGEGDISVWFLKIKARAKGRDLHPEEREFIRAYKGSKRLEKLLKYEKR